MRPARQLLHFAALGALLLAADRQRAQLLERDAFDEAVLAREARRLGLDCDDPSCASD